MTKFWHAPFTSKAIGTTVREVDLDLSRFNVMLDLGGFSGGVLPSESSFGGEGVFSSDEVDGRREPSCSVGTTKAISESTSAQ